MRAEKESRLRSALALAEVLEEILLYRGATKGANVGEQLRPVIGAMKGHLG